MCVVDKYSADGLVSFDEEKHEYLNLKNSKKLKSVTTLVHEHFPPFDEKAMARMLAGLPWAKAQKKGVKYWLQEWTNSRDEGTLCHAEVEKYLLDPVGCQSLFPVFHPRSLKAIEYIKGFLENYKVYDVVPEELLHNSSLAGQSDLVLHCLDNRVILDWKFTKRIKKDAYEKGATGTSSYTSHLVACNYNTYSLQLSIYAYLLELSGCHPERIVLVHVDPDGLVTPYEINYLRAEAKALVESVKNGNE